MHAPKKNIVLNKHFSDVSFEEDILPIIKNELRALTIAIEFVEAEHIIMHPVVFDDKQSLIKKLDDIPRALTYQKLGRFERTDWKPSGNNVQLALVVLPKVMSDKPALVKTTGTVDDDTLNERNSVLVEFYQGGLLFDGKRLIDKHGKGSTRSATTKLLESKRIAFPINPEKISSEYNRLLSQRGRHLYYDDSTYSVRIVGEDLMPAGPPPHISMSMTPITDSSINFCIS